LSGGARSGEFVREKQEPALEVAAAGALDCASPTAALQTVGATLATSNPSRPQAVLLPQDYRQKKQRW